MTLNRTYPGSSATSTSAPRTSAPTASGPSPGWRPTGRLRPNGRRRTWGSPRISGSTPARWRRGGQPRRARPTRTGPGRSPPTGRTHSARGGRTRRRARWPPWRRTEAGAVQRRRQPGILVARRLGDGAAPAGDAQLDQPANPPQRALATGSTSGPGPARQARVLRWEVRALQAVVPEVGPVVPFGRQAERRLGPGTGPTASGRRVLARSGSSRPTTRITRPGRDASRWRLATWARSGGVAGTSRITGPCAHRLPLGSGVGGHASSRASTWSPPRPRHQVASDRRETASVSESLRASPASWAVPPPPAGGRTGPPADPPSTVRSPGWPVRPARAQTPVRRNRGSGDQQSRQGQLRVIHRTGPSRRPRWRPRGPGPDRRVSRRHREPSAILRDEVGDHAAITGGTDHRLPEDAVDPQASARLIAPAEDADQRRVGIGRRQPAGGSSSSCST